MRKKLIAAVLIAAVLCSATYIVALGAAGDASDPLITMSYIEQVLIPKLKADIKASVLQEIGGTGTAPAGGTSSQYAVVTLYEGNTLTADGGSMEFVLRTGRALTVTVNAGEGISNLTAGVDQQGGEEVKHNNSYLVPRADGRGIKAQGECWVMVRGGYKIT